MNKYNFDQVVERRGTNSLKWDVKDKELPMWVADMDFCTAPEITETLKKRVEHGVFGYSIIPDKWYHAYMDWWKKRHGLAIEKEWLVFCTGVIPAISSAVRKLTTPGENILVQTPVYNIFFNSIVNNGRNPVECPLVYSNDQYHVDFSDLEEKLSDPQTSMMLLCNPQNPGGKIWERETLQKIGELCSKYHVTVISDEIHCDLTAPGCEYVPFASVSQECRQISITCVAPTKTFNIAGLQTAAVVVPNPNLRHKIWRGLNTDEVAEPNAFAIDAAVAAFTKGEPWLEQLRTYLWENRLFAQNFIKKELPKLHPVQSDATYLMWVDCREITQDAKEFTKYLREKTGLYVSQGGQFGTNGKTFIRINLACPRSVVEEGMKRLKRAVEEQ